jgi:S1-C subfamily serine protease
MYLGQVTYQADQLLIKNMGNLEFYLDDKIDAQSKDIVDLDLCLNGKLDHIVEANKMVDSTQTERIQRLYYAKDLINKEIAELSRLGRDDIDLEVVARVHTQVVRIQSGGGQGSGVILDNGRILTCAHIFQNGTEGKIELTDGRVFDFTEDQLTMHVDLDLSIIDLGIDLNIEKVELRYKQLILGEEVMVAGNPKGGGTFGFNTVTFGRITGMNRHIDPISSGGLWQGQELIQTDAPIEGGNSGGPIFDRDGKLIGIVVAKFPYTDGLGFAVPVEYILELYGRL